MTKKNRPTPWRELVHLKEELRSGELALAEFAADLHDVVTASGKRRLYEDPAEFFALTYLTHPLRELAKDVALRLAGKSDKAVRQLELTYGGGKTHTLITLYHLFGSPRELPDLPAVREFREHLGETPPRAFAAALCFDKIDAEKGIDGARAPDGAERALKHPWSVLAYQLAGDDGLRAIHADGRAEERETPPAEPLLAKLLETPRERGIPSTLVLVDEVLMYAGEKAALDPVWESRLTNFFQHLSQAVGRVDTAALVVSLLSSDPTKAQGDAAEGVIRAISGILRRTRDEGVEPVGKEDVPEILRRRFFPPDDFRDLDAHRPQAIAVARNLTALESDTKKTRQATETRLLDNFPFHPDLTDVFYGRWTQLSGFQRTRGILRVLASAMRQAEEWDNAPLIGPSAFLSAPGASGLSESVRELADIATKEPGDRSSDWAALLATELEKARQAQDETPALLEGREIEQAVLAVFFHSQPAGRKAGTPDLLRLIGSGGANRIELEKGLRRWRQLSWFLDDEDTGLAAASDEIPRSWRLGNRPNLRQMHDEAVRRISGDSVRARLLEGIKKAKKALTEGAQGAGAVVHLLPPAPKDVADDGKFRYVVLPPEAVSDSGKPSRTARRFLEETTGAERPRAHRNAVLLVVPGRDGLLSAELAARTLLGWEEVERELSSHAVDPAQKERLRARLGEARRNLPGQVRQAYSVVVTLDEDGKVAAFRLPGSAEPLFRQIRDDRRSRVRDQEVNSAALMPDGPYDLWREGEDARPLKDIVGSFSRLPRMPKLLRPELVVDTVMQGVENGRFAARLRRPDGTARTWWREAVDAASRDDALEIVLPEKAELSELAPGLLAPGVLPDLWSGEGPGALLRWDDLLAYFAGGRAAPIPGEEPVFVPRCGESEVAAAAAAAVEDGTVWLDAGAYSLWKEPVPAGALRSGAALRPPPRKLEPAEIGEDGLPAAWENGATTGAALLRAASHESRQSLPWGVLRDSIRGAVDARWLKLSDDSGPVDCDVDAAALLRLTRPSRREGPPEPAPIPPGPVAAGAELDDAQFMDLAEKVGDLRSASAGHELRFEVRISVAEDAPAAVRAEIDRLLGEISEALKTG